MSSALVIATIVVVMSADRDSVPFTRVRSTQPYTTTLLREAYDRSPTFRGLVDSLQQSNATVVVQLGACKGGRIRSCVVSVTGSERARHIWIKVDPHTTNDRLLATIAHELQHAVEIVEHTDVSDATSVLRLYRTISFGKCREGLSEECETERALATERRVLEELFHTPRQNTFPDRNEDGDQAAGHLPVVPYMSALASVVWRLPHRRWRAERGPLKAAVVWR